MHTATLAGLRLKEGRGAMTRAIDKRIRRNRLMVHVCFVFTLVSGLGMSTLIAQAAAPAPPGVLASSVGVPMTIDCVNMSKPVHAYAVSHGYCPSTKGTVGYGTTRDNCGSSWLILWDEGNRTADFAYGFQSTIGNVVYRSLGINWNNLTGGEGGLVTDSSWMNNSYYNTDRRQVTGTGFVTATMTGWVQLWWGAQCTIVPPSDSVTVT